MKKLFFNSIAALFMTALITFSACKKEGPAGAAGAQGQKGDAGATGADGEDGEPGTANVKYSEWMDVAYKADTVKNAEGVVQSITHSVSVEATELDSAILAGGEIKVFVNLNTAASPHIASLPYSNDTLNIQASYGLKAINLSSAHGYKNPSTTTVEGGKMKQYRYVLIPGGVKVSARQSGISVNWDDYNSVKNYLNLID